MTTRQQYLEANSTATDTFAVHCEYYGQFVTPAVKELVVRTFGKERIVKCLATDKHLNNIPLKLWDNLDYQIRRLCEKSVKEHGDFWSLSQAVCIAKEAARQIANE